jgi:hypothetical protein
MADVTVFVDDAVRGTLPGDGGSAGSGRRGAMVSVSLDASRRWVTLRGVHPAFATACRDHEQQVGQRR